ncbi:hypothetical protein ABDK56_12880 [Sphingomonas sp. ASV193]|uniref:hypothetical protein n=1 Tax=Sphingomonas sp. ASV193 TaxID=3144405 RepID=UPI0032E8F0FB
MQRAAPILALFALAGCAGDPTAIERLRPRAAERIDPRVAVPVPPPAPRTAGLAARLDALVAAARAGAAPFDAALPAARAAANAAGPAQSESWIAAQEQVSALDPLRAPVAKALADLDAMAGGTIEAKGWVGQRDLGAIQAAAAEVAAIDSRQQAAIAELRARLGR